MKIYLKYSTLLFIVIIKLLSTSCGSNKNGESHLPPGNEDVVEQKEQMLKVNKYLVKKDSEIIEAYIERTGWDMQETKSGLWYEILEKGNGKSAETGMTATLAYEIKLLDGTPCYEGDSLNPKTFTLGKGGVESGLEEGILLLNEGSKARFILPPHLAYGLIGDENKIPARATIIYEVKLLSLSEK